MIAWWPSSTRSIGAAHGITVTFHPAISVPAGFRADSLPVGIQLVGRYRDDPGVLQLAHALEQATRIGERRPSIAARA